MATTISEYSTHAAGGLNFLHLKLTAGAADTTVTYTHVPGKVIKSITLPFKTTGSAGACNAVYVESTGVITISGLANNDVVRFTVIF